MKRTQKAILARRAEPGIRVRRRERRDLCQQLRGRRGRLPGRPVHRPADPAGPHSEPVVDSGTRTARTYRTADRGYALGVRESGVLTGTLVTRPDFGRPVLTDDGVIATTIGDTAATFRHSCPA